MERLQRRLASPEPTAWLFYGDSITHGALHTYGWRDYPQLFEERLRWELGRSLDVVIKTAISGHTSQSLLESFAWRVERFRPHVVFVMVGMNDCAVSRQISREQFRANLHELVRRCRAIDALPVLQTTNPIIPGGSLEREPHFDDYMALVRQIARTEELPLIDHTDFWYQSGWPRHAWMDDPFHPNQFGHRALARLIFRELGIDDDQSVTCRLLVP